MNWLEWYRIVADRDVDDIPRIALVANVSDDAFWILDARAEDGVSTIYTIHDAGHSLAEATALFERQVEDATTLDAVGCIPVDHVQFDATQLKLMGPPIT